MRRRSRCVAATSRTSIGRCSLSPRRLIVRDSSTRSSFGCSASGSSPISSRKIVPPCAASNDPARAATAPVNAPRACPNSSPSIDRAGQRRAVDDHERPRRARRRVVDRPRGQLLACAGLAEDQHRSRRSARRAPSARTARASACWRRSARRSSRPATARWATPPPDSAAPPRCLPRGCAPRPAPARRPPACPRRMFRSGFRDRAPRSRDRSAPARRAGATPRGPRCAPARPAPIPASFARDRALVRAGLVGPGQLGPAPHRARGRFTTQLRLVVVFAGGHRGSLYRITGYQRASRASALVAPRRRRGVRPLLFRSPHSRASRESG